MGVPWINLGQILPVNAKKHSRRICLKDKERSFTFPQTNARANRLANSLQNLGLSKGEKIAVLMDNSIEICELYFAAAKVGLVAVPLNFRLALKDMVYIAGNSDSTAFLFHREFLPVVQAFRSSLPAIRTYIVVGGEADGCLEYEALLAGATGEEPRVLVEPEDTWIILYTSGTTGKPKGSVRSHESYVAFYLINAVDFRFTEEEYCLNVMPLCHVNSTFFTLAVTYVGGSVYVHPARSFDPEEILSIIHREKITFISLIPTHYNIILSLPREKVRKYDVSSVRKLLCSSAPARREMKKAVMDFFPGVQLYEGYGSTEAGIVTTLMPWEQYEKLGSIGRESLGTDFVKILDEKGKEVPPGEVGEIFSRSPMLFDEYYKMPEKTAASFRNGWFSAGDMGKMDDDGYYYIVDRKDNLIITGGEHVYPSEVEEVISLHPSVFDVAVIGVPHEKWGECVMAVVALKEGKKAEPGEIIEFCGDKMASFKKPKKVAFVSPEEMPRTGSGKILHRVLRERFSLL